jgi:uncharacterized protein YkwD
MCKPTFPALAWLVATLLLGAWPASAAGQDLLELINAYRADPPACDGVASEALPPLARDPALAGLEVGAGRQLQEALRRAGYQAADAQVLMLSGPVDAQQAMRAAAARACRMLQARRYVDAGVARDGNRWQIVLARPLLAPELGDWREAGQKVLQQVNAARAQPRDCGQRRFDAAGALEWDERLAAAARAHSRDMAQRDFVGHEGSDGSSAAGRARRAGYAWKRVGENVAAGQGSPQKVVEGWLASPAHCANIMNPAFIAMGAAYALNRDSDTVIFWTQVFAVPR